MAKSFKKFREDREYDDEWGHNEERYSRSKEKKMKNRRDKRKMKREEKYSRFDKDDG